MASGSAQVVVECPTISVQKPGLVIRCYSRSDDLDRIRDMFVQSTLNGPDAPYNVVTSRFAPRILRACTICTTGLGSLCVLLVKPTWVSKLMSDLEETLIPAWIVGTVSVVSALVAAYLWHRQSAVHNMFRIYIEDALAYDLNDIPAMFGLSSQVGSPECFPVGSRGFWVATEEETIIGFVGLDVGASEDEKIGEVRRMVVSPSHRRRGVGKELMDTVDRHAKANRFDALELTTSDFNVGALKMYKKNGWRLKRPRIYAGVLLHILRKDL